jgi:hypothetical protein
LIFRQHQTVNEPEIKSTMKKLRRNATLAVLTLTLFGCAEPKPEVTTTTTTTVRTTQTTQVISLRIGMKGSEAIALAGIPCAPATLKEIDEGANVTLKYQGHAYVLRPPCKVSRTSRWRRTAAPLLRSTLGGNSGAPRALHRASRRGRSPLAFGDTRTSTKPQKVGERNMAKCPHCKKSVTLNEKAASADSRPVRKEVIGKLKKEVMYSCPHCDCVLGFGFFFGGVLTGRP